MRRDEMVKKFADNLEQERFRLGLSQEVMAGKLDMSLATYKRLITYNVDKVDLYTTYKLYQLTGKVAYEYLGINDHYLDVKRKIMDLSPSQLNYIEGIIDFEVDFARSDHNTEDYVTVYVPTGNMEDGMVYDTSSVTKVNIAPYRAKYGSQISCGIKVTSNHLHPAYNEGDILLISRQAIRDGDTGIFFNRTNGCVYVRKFRQTSPCRLEPISSYGETFYVDSNNKADMDKWIKFGFVIAKMR